MHTQVFPQLLLYGDLQDATKIVAINKTLQTLLFYPPICRFGNNQLSFLNLIMIDSMHFVIEKIKIRKHSLRINYRHESHLKDINAFMFISQRYFRI